MAYDKVKLFYTIFCVFLQNIHNFLKSLGFMRKKKRRNLGKPAKWFRRTKIFAKKIKKF